MKTIISSLFSLITTLSYSQISLEHTFSSNASTAFLSAGNRLWTHQNNVLTIYNPDYSVFRAISTPIQSGSLGSAVVLVTDRLVNSDDAIEYVLLNVLGANDYLSKLYSETGQELQNFGNSLSVYVAKVNNEYKILTTTYNTSVNPVVTFTKVYSVPGEYPQFISVENSVDNYSGYSIAYPNPSQFNAQIDYQLPQGHNSARLVLTNISGQTVKTWDVNGFNGKILINTTEFPAGIYTYSIVVNNAISSSGKLVFQ
jgi:hypothetical protein